MVGVGANRRQLPYPVEKLSGIGRDLPACSGRAGRSARGSPCRPYRVKTDRGLRAMNTLAVAGLNPDEFPVSPSINPNPLLPAVPGAALGERSHSWYCLRV